MFPKHVHSLISRNAFLAVWLRQNGQEKYLKQKQTGPRKQLGKLLPH